MVLFTDASIFFTISDGRIKVAEINRDHFSSCSYTEGLRSGISPPGSDEPTWSILDYLNEHCWQHILDYVPVVDIIRSERVCRRWRDVVHRYLRENLTLSGVNLCVYFEEAFLVTDIKVHPGNRICDISCQRGYCQIKPETLSRFLEKFGQSMVYSDCPSRKAFGKIVKCCPKLKSLAIDMFRFGSGPLSQKEAEFVAKLERILFLDYITCDHDEWKVTPDDIYAFKEIEHCHKFWPNFQPANLKALTIRGTFDLDHFLGAVEHYPKLSELNLPGELKGLHSLLAKTPKLERLCISDFETNWDVYDKEAEILESLSGLTVLTRLVLYFADDLGRMCMDTVFDNCPFLQHLYPDITAITKATRPSVSELRLMGHLLRGSQGAAIMDAFPNLTMFDMRGTYSQEPDLDFLLSLAGAASRRSKPLLLRIDSDIVDKVHCPWWTVDKEGLYEAGTLYTSDGTRPRGHVIGCASDLRFLKDE